MTSAKNSGFVFATTGLLYTTLARRAARSLRQVMPDAQIDLFTDLAIADDVFDEIHRLEEDFFRPKMEAVRRSRFDRTIYLDADIVVLADVSELFDLLDRFDLAGCQGWSRLPDVLDNGAIPRAFPMLNGGLIGVRKNEATLKFFHDWEVMVRETGAIIDQKCYRDTLFASDISFVVVPMEYNLIYLQMLDAWTPVLGAPRILHFRDLHRADPGDPHRPFDLQVLLSPQRLALVRELLAKDAARAKRQARVPALRASVAASAAPRPAPPRVAPDAAPIPVAAPPVSPYEAPGFYDKALAENRHRDIVGGRWDETGALQLALLREAGLEPHHRLLDIGCGALRLGCRAVPYLDPGNYWGTDASGALMLRGWEVELADKGRLSLSQLVEDDDFSFPGLPPEIDYAIAFAVFTHLPVNHLRRALLSLRARFPGLRQFLFTVFLAPDAARFLGQVRQPDGVVTHALRPPYHMLETDLVQLVAASGFRCQLLPARLPRGQVLVQAEPARSPREST